MRKVDIKTLNSLKDVPKEQWAQHGVFLSAVSANADGEVNSGILRTGQYFFRKWSAGFTESHFVFDR